jgi:hypothetical protein
LDSGVIVPVQTTENVEWVSQGFFVAKPNGKVRLVTDLRSINKFVICPCHPFPSPRDVVRNIKIPSGSVNWMPYRGTIRSHWMKKVVI